MKKTSFPKPAFLSLLLLLAGSGLFAQSSRETGSAASTAADADIPLRRVALFSSGVGFFEHTGTVAVGASFNLPFNVRAVNDALKSLVISVLPANGAQNAASPEQGSLSVRYPSEDTLYYTLRSLAVDLSGNPGIADILRNLQGEEIEVLAPNPIRGRIITVETRPAFIRTGSDTETGDYLSLYTAQGIRVIRLGDIGSFSFSDPKINADINRALDLIMGSRDSETRNLQVSLDGTTGGNTDGTIGAASGNRDIALSYVIPAPVWKVSYRLDLAQKQPFIQGWAIVDNDSDTDWQEVELSLVTGRPVSFIQDLYAPYRLSRPVVPLAIAGIAEAQTYDSGWDDFAYAEEAPAAATAQNIMSASAKSLADSSVELYEPRARGGAVPSPAAAGGARVVSGLLETAEGQAAGDQFEFTIKKPVTLNRRQSAMLPLVEGTITAEKTLVFSGAQAIVQGASIHPAISAELTNTTGMKLPAGPITVYDGGTYAGDALIEFFPEGEKRIISYGDDLSVTGSVLSSNARVLSSVSVSQGVMTFNRKIGYEKIYSFRNAGESKKLILEHPITNGAALIEPESFTERTSGLYRFALTLPANGEIRFTIREETGLDERITLSELRLESFISYASNQEISPAVRAALQRAVELKRKADAAQSARTTLEVQRTWLISEQDRIRRNLEAAGSQTPQGQEYLRRLSAQDDAIDHIGTQIETADRDAQAAQKAYDDYIGGLNM